MVDGLLRQLGSLQETYDIMHRMNFDFTLLILKTLIPKCAN